MYPTFNQFARWANQYRVIPLWMEPQLPSRELLEWAHSLLAHETSFFLLHSAPAMSTVPPAGRVGWPAGSPSGFPEAQARYSYLALDAPRYHVEAIGDTLTLRHRTSGGT